MENRELRILVTKGGQEIEFAAKLWGFPDGEPWLLLHGWLDNASSFDVLAPLLCQKMPRAQFLCIDMAGHGLSRHRPDSIYHFIDYVADAYLVTEAMGWKHFSIIGHSLGQSVGAILAGSVPDQVKHLVLIEGIGPHTNHPEEVPVSFEKSLKAYLELAKPKRIYASRKEATERRVQGNAVGPLPATAAEILVSRGTIPSDSAISYERKLLSQHNDFSVWEVKSTNGQEEECGSVTWTFDEGVKQASRVRLSESVVQSFFKRIRCPSLLILAKDGLLSRRGAKPTLITTLRGKFFLITLFYLCKVGSWIPFIGRKFAPIAKKLSVGVNMATRYSSVNHIQSLILPSGGHHPHLLEKEASMIADGIAQFIK